MVCATGEFGEVAGMEREEMTRLIYDEPIEQNGKMIVSTEVLTHYRCPSCDNFSSASDLEIGEAVYCRHCGVKVELPEVYNYPQILAKYFPTEKVELNKVFSASDLMEALNKTNAISPGMPNRGVK